MKIKNVFFVLSLLFVLQVFSMDKKDEDGKPTEVAQLDSAAKRKELIAEFIKVTFKNKYEVISALKSNMQSVLGKEFAEKANKLSTEICTDENFSQAFAIVFEGLDNNELQAVIDFNKSSAGVKLNDIMPKAVQEMHNFFMTKAIEAMKK